MTRVFAGLFLSFALWGQIEQGSLVGVVTDPQKAPVAGAAVDFLSLTTQELLDEQKHVYEERNTTENPAYLGELASRGIMVLPTVFVGEDVVTGFRPNTLLEKLAA